MTNLKNLESSATWLFNNDEKIALLILVGSPSLGQLKDAVFDYVFEHEHIWYDVVLDLREAELEGLSSLEKFAIRNFVLRTVPELPFVALVVSPRRPSYVEKLVRIASEDGKCGVFESFYEANHWLQSLNLRANWRNLSLAVYHSDSRAGLHENA